MFIGRTDAKAEAPILWLPDAKKRPWKRVFPRTLWKRPFFRTVGKDPDAEKDQGQEEKGITEDEMVGCITSSISMSLNKLWEMVKDKEAWSAAVHGGLKGSGTTQGLN